MFLLILALKNLLRQKRRLLLTLGTMVIGFLFLSVSIGLSEGSYVKIIDVFTKQKTGHIQIHKEDYLDKPSLYKKMDSSFFEKLNSFSFIKSYTPRVISNALAFSNDKALGAALYGIDFTKEFNTTLLKTKVSEGEFKKNKAAISYSLKKALHLQVGDEIVLISNGADGSISNDVFEVSAIVGTKDDIQNTFVIYLEIGTLRDFLSMNVGDFHEIAIITDSYSKAPKYAKKIKTEINNTSLDIQPWQVVEKSFYDAMQVDIKGMWISLFIVMLIVGFGVLNTVLMALFERKKEYGIMKALGTTPRLLFCQIMTEMTILSLVANVIGFFFSIIANGLLTIYGIPLKPPVEFGGVKFSTYQSCLSFDTFFIPFILILLTTIVISFFPAFSTARKKCITSISSF